MRLAPLLLLQLLGLALLFSTYGFSSSTILIVPASLFRDGFHLNSLSLLKMDLFLGCFLGVANAVWIYSAAMERRNRGSRCRTANQGDAREAQKS